jgi:hypothetical protein
MRLVTHAIRPCSDPDTPGSDYITGDDDRALFTDAEADQLDAGMERAFRLLEAAGRDPYTIAHKVQRRQLGLQSEFSSSPKSRHLPTL